MDNFITTLHYFNAQEKTDEFFYYTFKPTKEQSLQYFKLRRMEQLIFESVNQGFEKLDWVQMHKAGKFCRNDYEIF